MVITDDEELYRRAFAFHDQGHSPLRTGVEIGKRPFLGLDFRYTELQAAVLLAQLRKLPDLIDLLQTKKRHLKAALADLPGLAFREVLDAEEEVATILTVILPTAEIARKVAEDLESKVVAEAGWHVYNNMEHLAGTAHAYAAVLFVQLPPLRRKRRCNAVPRRDATAYRRPAVSLDQCQYRRVRRRPWLRLWRHYSRRHGRSCGAGRHFSPRRCPLSQLNFNLTLGRGKETAHLPGLTTLTRSLPAL